MTDVTASASGGSSSNYGVFQQGGTATIHHSILFGSSNSLFVTSGSPVRVGASQLRGLVSVIGSATCAASYNGNFVALNAACQ
jgi:hypothetical protein